MAQTPPIHKLIGEVRVFQFDAEPSGTDAQFNVGDIGLLTAPAAGGDWAYVYTATGWKTAGHLAA